MPHYTLESVPLDRSKMFSISKLEARVRRATAQIREGMITDLRSAVATWKTAVAFRSRVEFSYGNLELYVFTTSKVFRFVNEGTVAHLIKPRRGKYLRFQTGFIPKTQVRQFSSSPGGRTGSYVSKQSVAHPGAVARNFTDALAVKYRNKYHTLMLDTIQKFFSRL